MKLADYSVALKKRLEEVEDFADSNEEPIDAGVKLLVAALWAHGFRTNSSCEGYEALQTGGPMVWIASPESRLLGPQAYGEAALKAEKQRIRLFH